MSKKFSSPKRRIERRRNRVDVLLTSSIASNNLHVASDAHTLVRTIVNLSMVHISGTAVEADYHITIQRAERSVRIVSPTIAQELAQDAPIALIWEDSSTLDMASISGAASRKEIQADLKGMRKLKEGDTIEISMIASSSSVLRLVGTVTLFFKE